MKHIELVCRQCGRTICSVFVTDDAEPVPMLCETCAEQVTEK